MIYNKICNVAIARITTDDVTRGGIYYIKELNKDSYKIKNEIGEQLTIPYDDDTLTVMLNVKPNEITELKNVLL